MSDWFSTARSSAFRVVRLDQARSTYLRSDAPLIARAAALALVVAFSVLALAIIIPLLLIGAIVFAASFLVLKTRQLVTGLFGSALPRDDGRRNVRVRLPADSAE